MTSVITWFATNVAGPLYGAVITVLLVICLIFGVSEHYQLYGMTFIKDLPLVGKYAFQGYRPMYDALVQQGLDQKLAHAEAVIKENGLRITTLEKTNSDYQGQIVILNTRLASITPQEIIRYVPKNVATPCLPLGFGMLLDAAATGADISNLAAPAGKPFESCSDVDMSSAATILVSNLKHYPEFGLRIGNALEAWNAQRAVIPLQ